MNKKLLIFGLIVFIALSAMSYVNAAADIQTDSEFEDMETGSIDQCKDIHVSDSEEKVLKDGKSITKKVNIVKEVKTYSKTKKITIECSKKLTKTNIKKCKIGGQYEKNILKAKSVLKGAKIKSIKIKIVYKKLRAPDDLVHKVKIYKATIKYQPVVYKTLAKSTIATIKLDKYGDVEFKYVNPFNGKKETEYGDILYY